MIIITFFYKNKLLTQRDMSLVGRKFKKDNLMDNVDIIIANYNKLIYLFMVAVQLLWEAVLSMVYKCSCFIVPVCRFYFIQTALVDCLYIYIILSYLLSFQLLCSSHWLRIYCNIIIYYNIGFCLWARLYLENTTLFVRKKYLV